MGAISWRAIASNDPLLPLFFTSNGYLAWTWTFVATLQTYDFDLCTLSISLRPSWQNGSNHLVNTVLGIGWTVSDNDTIQINYQQLCQQKEIDKPPARVVVLIIS